MRKIIRTGFIPIFVKLIQVLEAKAAAATSAVAAAAVRIATAHPVARSAVVNGAKQRKPKDND